ncbi:MAG: excinuclease ABC subunit UvrB, partial [candidate division Zixibacteria bacterium]|nr:excinuclease ABC subunit UvrB [candidate division Zixibacteria bacterium]
GSPDDYRARLVFLEKNQETDRDEFIRNLIDIHYSRNDINFVRGNFRVRGDTLELIPAYTETALRFEFFGDRIERISEFNPLTGEILSERDKVAIYPAKHFLTSAPKMKEAIKRIEKELDERLEFFRSNGQLLEAQRIEMRTNYDLEMMKEIGYCSGVENYSRHLSGREAGERPSTLIDFFPDDFLIFADESHQTMPQLRGMHAGDRSRKEVLVEHGFRLPSALDNRPLFFEEFEKITKQIIYMSATPADYELERCEGVVVEQLIRPTGLVDPEIVVRPLGTQVDDLLERARERAERGERTLVTTLTKRMAEDLTDYMNKAKVRVRYLHSEIATIDRTAIIRDLRLGEFDVLVGVNLLREGLDLPEVSLVAILDADNEGFLRSERSLIQTAGRAARNAVGEVIFYADRETNSIVNAMRETSRRRKIQQAYNEKHGITPESIIKSRREILQATRFADTREVDDETRLSKPENFERMAFEDQIAFMTIEMKTAADNLDFETAALARDEIAKIHERLGAKGRKSRGRGIK